MQAKVDRLKGKAFAPSEGPITVALPRVMPFMEELEGGELLEGQIELDGSGRYRLTALDIRGGAITNEVLRSIAVGRLIARAAADAGVDIVRFTPDGRRRIDISKSLTIDEQVLALFWVARAAGENANVIIAEQLDITPAAASQRVARLRKRIPPWLPPAEKRGARR
jgi:hypothetical protein